MMDILIFLLVILVLGVLPSIWFYKRKEKDPVNTRPGILLIGATILIVLINSFFSYIIGKTSIAYVLGSVFVLPLILMGIFALFKSSRNMKSMFKIMFFSSIIIFLSLIGNLLAIVNPQ